MNPNEIWTIIRLTQHDNNSTSYQRNKSKFPKFNQSINREISQIKIFISVPKFHHLKLKTRVEQRKRVDERRPVGDEWWCGVVVVDQRKERRSWSARWSWKKQWKKCNEVYLPLIFLFFSQHKKKKSLGPARATQACYFNPKNKIKPYTMQIEKEVSRIFKSLTSGHSSVKFYQRLTYWRVNTKSSQQIKPIIYHEWNRTSKFLILICHV
jgi:hypothetical protein